MSIRAKFNFQSRILKRLLFLCVSAGLSSCDGITVPTGVDTKRDDSFVTSVNSDVLDVKPEKIIDIIKEQQALYVKNSDGIYANQCFTDSDLVRFNAKGILVIVGENLRKSGEFHSVALVINKMNTVDRQKLLLRAQNTFKPTWAELGKISSEGQTDAGQTAEKLIAQAIVDLISAQQ